MTTTIVFNYPNRTLFWWISLVVNWILIILSLYLFFSMIHYGKRTGKWKRTRKSKLEKLNSGRIYISILLCAFCCLFRLTISQVFFYVGFNVHKQWECKIEMILSTIAYLMVQLSFYLFLWFRQRVFYANDMLSVAYRKSVKYLSLFSIILVSFSFVAVAALPIFVSNEKATVHGCVAIKNRFTNMYSGSLATAIIIGYVILFGLLMYPIRSRLNCGKAFSNFILFKKKNTNFPPIETAQKHPATNTCTGIKSSDIPQNSSLDNCIETKEIGNVCLRDLRKKKFYKQLQKTVRRTLIFTILPFTVDSVLLPTIFAFNRVKTGHFQSNMAYDVGGFLHLLLVVMSFTHYKEIVFSPFIGKIHSLVVSC